MMKTDFTKIKVKDVEADVMYEKTKGVLIAKVYYNEHWISAVGENNEDAYSKLKSHIYTETEFSI